MEKLQSLSNFVVPNKNTANEIESLTKTLYEFGQNINDEEVNPYKKFIKQHDLSANNLIVNGFGCDEIYYQIRDKSKSILSSVNQRINIYKNEPRLVPEISNLTTETNDNDDINDSGNDELEPTSSNDTDNMDNDDNGANNEDILENIDDDGSDGMDDNDGNDMDSNEESNDEDGHDNDALNDNDMDNYDDDEDFGETADKLEEFLSNEMIKKKNLFESGDIEVNDDLEQQLLIEDDLLNDNDNDENETNDFDEFAWLENNKADSDRDNDNETKNNDNNNNNNNDNDNDSKDDNNDDGWKDLFNLPNFQEIDNSMKPKTNDDSKDNDKDKQKNKSNLSAFELEDEMIKEKIKRLEENNLKERSWEYRGEMSTNTEVHGYREKNSLLDKYLDFDYGDKLKPIITMDLNKSIENLIITKIKNNEFDDIERKLDLINKPTKSKRKLIQIQDTKSSMGLAELYERQYLQEIENKEQEMNDINIDDDVKMNNKYAKIIRLKSNLFYDLDQLSRYNYLPKNNILQTNIKIKTNTNPLFLEEITPYTQNNTIDGTTTLTANELYKKPKFGRYMKGDNEMTKNDRKQKRRMNKKKAAHKKKLFDQKDKIRAKYDEHFSKHLNKLKSLNDIRQHTMAQAKKDGLLNDNNNNNDTIKYTSSKQMFNKISILEQNKKNTFKRKSYDPTNQDNIDKPKQKRQKTGNDIMF